MRTKTKPKRKALRNFRVSLDLTQAEFAEKIGYSRSVYSLIEQGKLNATQKFGLAIQKAFSVPDSDMWEMLKMEE